MTKKKIILISILILMGLGFILLCYGYLIDNEAKSVEKVGGMLKALALNEPKTEVIAGVGRERFASQSLEIKVLSSDQQRALRPISVKIQLNEGYTFPSELTNYLEKQGIPAANFLNAGRMTTIPKIDKTLLKLALAAAAVKTIEIGRLPTFGPFFQITTRNLNARISHHVDTFASEFSGIEGQNISLAIFDEGGVRKTHQEFLINESDLSSTRIDLRTPYENNEHATHIAGTIAACGRNPLAKGMAPQAKIISFDWKNDLNKLAEIAPSIQISNHSYVQNAGWDQDDRRNWLWYGDTLQSSVEDAKFGKYSSNEEVLDGLLCRFPNLISVAAAGNDRNDGPNNESVRHYIMSESGGNIHWISCFAFHKQDGFDQGGIDTISGLGLAKNAICVGAVNDIPRQHPEIQITDFSSWGPADDGRIKPDVVANGVQLVSSSAKADASYTERDGTSMATPTTAGIAALLVQQFEKVFGRKPQAIEIKAVLIHSATDAGQPGPDPIFGWGVVDALKAGLVIDQKHRNNVLVSSITSGEVALKKPVTYELVPAPGPDGLVRLTLVWSDPPAPTNLAGLDDATLTLQNDLDLILVAPDKTIIWPYSLNRADPLAPATRTGPNRVDNVEVIDVNIPGTMNKGTWKLIVEAAKLKQGAWQKYALILSGFNKIK